MSAGLQVARVPEFWEVDLSEIEWSGEKLDSGGYGSVYRGWWTGIPVALKQVILDESRAFGDSATIDVAPPAESATGTRQPSASSSRAGVGRERHTVADPKGTLFRETRTELPGRTTRTFAADDGSGGGYTRKRSICMVQLSSLFVLPLYGIGNDVNGKPLFVSPIMENENAQDYLEQFKKKCNGDDEAYQNECLNLLYDIARGMAYLHNIARVKQTDLKSGNVLITAQGHGVITDFGFAQRLGDDASSAPRTIWYMPPERLASFLDPHEPLENPSGSDTVVKDTVTYAGTSTKLES
ncbi:kinase-like protein [Gonapodya prolifera JEL478]|uniref:Kinase-like protein n=1 Tax=Gonapodya prolifera (strain JEL478) TaxID=1344416 RepID=A0A139A3Q2_GONPJ|nr:kinase-like protein [Gonapodya prolifera JEL478]|eukprot:KXS11446.1 kinase-like protein [Gonapodya prolifera JEL478]